MAGERYLVLGARGLDGRLLAAVQHLEALELMAAPLLIADIGATNARFALVGGGGEADGGGDGMEVLRLATADHQDAQTLLAAVHEGLDFDTPGRCCVAMAGPVKNGRGAITNAQLTLDADDLSARLGCPSLVVNDFYALAHAVPTLKRLRQVGGSEPTDGTRAVLGPGSGLGMSVLMRAPGPEGALFVLPSEGGHGDLAPASPLEMEVLQVLANELPHVSWESVLSGPGLVNIYRALCAVWGVQPDDVEPEWVTAMGVNADEPICHQVLELFFGFLGAAAGNLALTVCAQGGVYIGGGIVPALAEFAASSPMRRRFEERGALSAYAGAIPIYLILDENPGLLGALACLQMRA